MRRIVLALVLVAVGAPAVASGSAPEPKMLGPYGKGADAYWLWKAHGTPKSVVVFEHGSDVIYPRYERFPAGDPALLHSLIGIHAGLVRLGRLHLPIVLVGYSRGGRLAVEVASVMWRISAKPAAVMSVFPSNLNPKVEEVVNFTHLPYSTRLLLVAGDEDSPAGVRELLRRLERSAFPPAQIRVAVIHSRGKFHADHFSALQWGPQAQHQFWLPLDRLIASVR